MPRGNKKQIWTCVEIGYNLRRRKEASLTSTFSHFFVTPSKEENINPLKSKSDCNCLCNDVFFSLFFLKKLWTIINLLYETFRTLSTNWFF